jgi:hypothetical protein
MKNEHNILNPFVPCSALIFPWDNHLVSTYCMRERGHADEQVKGFPGGHNIVNAAPVVKVQQ